ncbi:MAG TPA: type II toxin-antitoxin system VapC family toxin [Thermoanaerobaculia bacterium]|nr:type II toxin-antitoxin system VapC family toxin [Thermoanaerobaculia bacterium]
MRYLLDTNVWVDYLRQRSARVISRVRSSDPDDLALSSVVLAELRYGAERSQRSDRNHAQLDILVRDVPLLDFDASAAGAFGRLRTALEVQGAVIGPYDMMIAAQALSQKLVLVTDNQDEFCRVPSLRLENWR